MSYLMKAALFSFVFLSGYIPKAQAFIWEERCNHEWEQAGGEVYADKANHRHAWALKCGVISQKQLDAHMTLAGDEMFLSFQKAGTGAYAPFDENAPCDAPGSWRFLTLCPYGCFGADEKILFGEEWLSLPDAHAAGKRMVTTLSSEASVLNPVIGAETEIGKYTSGVEKKDLMTFFLNNEMRLSVTEKHPMIRDNGEVVRADKIKVGDELLTISGPALILRIEKAPTSKHVWNIQPISENPLQNTLIAEGVITGSLRFQNEWADHATRTYIRDSITDAELKSFSISGHAE